MTTEPLFPFNPRLQPSLHTALRLSAKRHQRTVSAEARLMVLACLSTGDKWDHAELPTDPLPKGLHPQAVGKQTRRVHVAFPRSLYLQLRTSAKRHHRKLTVELRAMLQACLESGDAWQLWTPARNPTPARDTS